MSKIISVGMAQVLYKFNQGDVKNFASELFSYNKQYILHI